MFYYAALSVGATRIRHSIFNVRHSVRMTVGVSQSLPVFYVIAPPNTRAKD